MIDIFSCQYENIKYYELINSIISKKVCREVDK
jgi:hypothetical protein